ncbi:MAG TPA: transcription-repair coupling factor [Candidatus Eisenbacteria bacterium]|nr:transcription-repair coupling factor [Candidatus Eisenbacteria bacterium]
MSATDVYLRDDLAAQLDRLGGNSPQARELLAAMEAALAARGAGAAPRLALRGLAGAARAYLVSWLQRRLGVPVLYVVPHGEAFESACDDVEYFRGRAATLAFPEPDTLPYDNASPHPAVTADRLGALARLAAGGDDGGPWAGVLVATVRGVLQKVPAPDKLARAVLALRTGADVDERALLERLVFMGYERLPEVEAVGHFARRGGILDVWPVGESDPLRIELDGDTIASLRRFDAGTQRSLEQLADCRVLPRYEIVVGPGEAEAIAQRLRDAGDEAAKGGANLFHDGMERYAGLYDAGLVTLPDHLPAATLVILDDPEALAARAADLEQGIARAFAERREQYPLISPPETLFAPAGAWAALGRRPGADLMGAVAVAGERERYARVLLFDAAPAEPLQRSFERLRTHLAELAANGIQPVVLCDNAGQRDRLREMLGDAGATLGVGLLSGGFTFRSAGFALLTDHEIFARYRRRRRRLRRTAGLSAAELSALKPGDFVVHEDHGVGVYRGMKRLTLSGQETDCLELAYAGTDVLYVPVQQLGFVSRYAAGDGARPAVHALGGAQWQRTKARAKQAIQDMADELLRAYAARRALPGHAYRPDSVWQKELEASFPYEETPDQLAAIDDVRRDMEAPSPMDRLICGDVGYGKTEVAIRAAFKAVQDGRQVAVLVPTTILAQQHGHTFRERLADFPVKIEVLSRFRSPKEQKEVVARLARRDVDIVIGTHRLLSRDVAFADLGLVVIDEEHRFGVRQKERIRQLTRTVDVLALTATPIPRTLNLSLAGARDMSVIETPPQNRLPVHTEVLEYDAEVVTDAILREVDRGGQVFFVHNRIETIYNKALEVERLVPQVRVGVAHGQMGEHELEQVMLDFTEGRVDVLVSTMIIESGIDIPSVNTLIVDRADTLGLAQLYQLRGRVGRSSHRAYAYLMVPGRRVLTEDAEKRLRVIEEFDELGVGFKVALKDMEIRGAGNLLGPEQSGHILGLGFDLYVKLLEEAVAALKGEQEALRPEPRLLTDWSAYLPDDYVPDEHEKLALYRRLAELRSVEALDDFTLELLDRFGQLPEPAVALVELRRVRVLGGEALAESLRLLHDVAEITLRRPLKPAELRALVGALPFQVEFFSGREFGLRLRGEGLLLLNHVREALQALAQATRAEPASA